MSKSWHSHLSKTMLGRIRLSVYRQITGAEATLPSPQAVRGYLLGKFRENALEGGILRDLLQISTTGRVPFLDLPTPDLSELLRVLEREPLDSPQFLEVTDCPEPLRNSTGILVQRDPMKIGGQVYTVLLIGDSELSSVGYIEVRAFEESPSPILSIVTHSGMECFDAGFDASPEAELIFGSLNYLSLHRRFEYLTIEEASTRTPGRELFRGPDDPRFHHLIYGVKRGSVLCTEATVEMNAVRPFSPDFCLSIPIQEVKEFSAEFRRSLPRLLVYWDGDSFVVSDDYMPYLTYRYLAIDQVPVTIMGDYPADLGRPEQIGGWELVPGVVIDYGNGRAMDRESADLALEAAIVRAKSPPIPADLYAQFMVLSKLIQDPATTERDVHKFLYDYPTALDAYAVNALYEVQLGKQYGIDLILQYTSAERPVTLIELESPHKVLFTKTGRLRAPITHSLQQVEDWLRWWQENPTQIPSGFDPSLTPNGLVVVGRRTHLSVDERRRLAHLNQTRNVKLLTYDDLLDRLEAVITAVEDGSW